MRQPHNNLVNVLYGDVLTLTCMLECMMAITILCIKASIHQATLLLATVVTRLYQPCSRVVASLLQPGYNCCKQQSCLVYRGL